MFMSRSINGSILGGLLMSELNTTTLPPLAVRDQRLIDLTLAGDESSLRRFSQRMGAQLKDIRARAKTLGLTPRFVQACRLAGTRAALRNCLRCDDQFLSSGRHNRLCRGCARRD